MSHQRGPAVAGASDQEYFLVFRKMATKVCNKCETEQPLENFYARGEGLQNACKDCYRAYSRSRYVRRNQNHDLYLAYNDRIPGEVKIGASRTPMARCRDLDVGQNFRIVVAEVFQGMGHLEAQVQDLLHEHRVYRGRGKEWFRVSLDTARAAVELAITLQ